MNQPVGITDDADANAITIEQATARIRSVLQPPLETEKLSLSCALGRFCAEKIYASVNVPPFRASAMDGYAVRVNDCEHLLSVVGKSLAGHPGANTIATHSAQRIMTGAKVPDDADAVVQQENVSITPEGLKIDQLPVHGQHIRDAGSGIRAGSELVHVGQRITPAVLAMLAANGIQQITVQRRLKIAVFSTGDEVVNAGESPREGQIFDSNRALLLSMLESQAVELIDIGIVADTEQSVHDAFKAAIDADVVVSSGGVSVGEADYVKEVLSKIGKLNLWKIAMKPGRPLTFGQLDKQRTFFGLPGNPVSAALTCLLFVKPAIECLHRTVGQEIPSLTLPLKGQLRKNPGRVEYQRAVMEKAPDQQWLVSTTGLQDSHVLMSLMQANCLIELPVDSTGATDGELVKVIPYQHFGISPI